MRFTRRFTLIPFVLAASAAAQITSELGSLSSGCQAAATGLVTSSFGTCVNILGLVQVLSASGSIVTPLNSWLGGACTQTCSNATLSSAASTIQSGCASDITSGVAIATGLQTLTTNYTAVKDVLCLAAVSNNTYCLTNLLTSVQNATGNPVNVSSVTALLTGGTAGFATLLGSLPASSLCTDCTHALVSKLTVLAKDTSSSTTSLSSVSTECGASFVDGTIPSTVKVGTTASVSSSSSAAAVSSTSLKTSAGRTASGGFGSAGVMAAVVALAGGVWTLA